MKVEIYRVYTKKMMTVRIVNTSAVITVTLHEPLTDEEYTQALTVTPFKPVKAIMQDSGIYDHETKTFSHWNLVSAEWPEKPKSKNTFSFLH
jgi:hypothetical protein